MISFFYIKVPDTRPLFSRVQIVSLQAFEKFGNTTEALEAAAALVDSKLSKSLRKFIKAQCQGQTLAVADSKLGNIIKEKLVSESFTPPRKPYRPHRPRCNLHSLTRKVKAVCEEEKGEWGKWCEE